MNSWFSFRQGRAKLLALVAAQCIAASTSVAQDDADRVYRSATGLLNRGDIASGVRGNILINMMGWMPHFSK